MESDAQNKPTWVKNPHGVPSCLPKWLAEKNVKTKIGWEYTQAEVVPEKKRYPISEEMTEAGMRRRMGAEQRGAVVSEPEELMPELVAKEETPVVEVDDKVVLLEKAKALKIKGAHLMSVSKLKEKIELALN